MFSVSYTTRKPRGQEVDGESYHFVSREDFEAMLARDEFLEWAQVFGNYYGTHRGILEEARARQKDLVLDIDVQGARQLKAKIPEAVTVFILAPSRMVLEQRLRARERRSRRSDRAAAQGCGRGDPQVRRLRLCFDQPGTGGGRSHFERDCSRRARPAKQNRRSDPAHFGHISSLRYRRMAETKAPAQ